MAKIIKIGYTMFRLPNGMSTKDIQHLVGVFALLQRVESRYNFETSENLYYADHCESVQIMDLELIDATTAKQISDESHVRYKAKQAEAQSA